MIKTQQNRLSMFEAVHSYLRENESAFAETTELVEAMNTLRAKINTIMELDDLKSNVSKGRTSLKNETRDAAITAGNALAGAIYALAKKTKNVMLADKTSITISRLESIRDIELVLFLNSVKDIATEHLQSLSGFGITGEKFEEYKQKFNLYFEALTSRESSRAKRIGASKALVTNFSETEELLKSIGKLVEAYRDDNIQFFNGYVAARSIKDLGSRRKKQPDTSGQTSNSTSQS
jgi:hypothetical protein